METTIKLRRETKEALRELGRMGETYDDVIRRLIELASPRQRRVGRMGMGTMEITQQKRKIDPADRVEVDMG